MDRLDFHTNPVNREQLRRIKSRLESSGRRQSRSVRLAFGSNAISLRAPLLWLGGALLVAAALVTPTVRVNGVVLDNTFITGDTGYGNGGNILRPLTGGNARI